MKSAETSAWSRSAKKSCQELRVRLADRITSPVTLSRRMKTSSEASNLNLADRRTAWLPPFTNSFAVLLATLGSLNISKQRLGRKIGVAHRSAAVTKWAAEGARGEVRQAAPDLAHRDTDG